MFYYTYYYSITQCKILQKSSIIRLPFFFFLTFADHSEFNLITNKHNHNSNLSQSYNYFIALSTNFIFIYMINFHGIDSALKFNSHTF